MELNRAGNPLQIYWDFTLRMQDGSAKDFSLEGKSLNLTLITPRGKKSIKDYHVSGNVIDWLFSADYQTTYGDHSLMLEVLAPSGRVISTSTQYNFIRIIDESCLDDETEEGLDNVLLDEGDSVVLLSTVLHALRIMPVYPEVGPNSNWWVDGVDTGKPSTGMSAYEFAKENGYTGTEEEYAAECAAVPTLNEESRVATAAASEAAGNADRAAGEASRSATVANSASATATNAAEAANTAAESSRDQIEAVGRYIGNEVTPAAEAAKQAATKAINAAEAANNAAGSINGATDNANTAAEAANAAATRAERAIEEFGPAIANKADLENGKIIASQLPDYLLGQVMFGGTVEYSNVDSQWVLTPTQSLKDKYPEWSEANDFLDDLNASDYEGVYFIAKNSETFNSMDINVGDWIISNGSEWVKVDNTDAVASVAGLTGSITATALAAALADITDPNSLARKTDLPKKLSELENDIEIGGGGGSSDDSEIKEILSNIVDEEGYLYSNGEKVDMRFTRSLLPVGTSIPANANLNTIEYMKIGKYYCSQNVDAKTVKNCPVNMAFSMEVFNPLSTSVDDETTAEYTYRLRVLTPYDTGIRYTQCCRTSGTPGTWTYDSWYVTPRSKFALASSKNDGSAAIGATNKGVYIDSNGEIKAMSYTVAKSVPSNAVFTDTNTKVTSVGNHYAPAEDESQQIDAPSGEVVTGIKRDAAGHVVGVVSTPQTGGGDGYLGVYGDEYIDSEAHEDGTYLKTDVAENLDEVSARGQLADAYDVKIFVENAVQGGGGETGLWTKAEGEAGVRLKGTNGTATGTSAISAGDDKTASDGTPYTSAASGDHAVVFGFGNTCSGRSTLAQGLYNTVNGKDSVAFGQRNTVNGDQAFAAGQQNEVTTRLGVAIGYKNKAENTNSIAIGYQNTSSGSGSVALGDTCESSGTSSTAMGYKTKASGDYSATFGENTQATNNGEVAMGSYNKSTTSTDASEQTAFSFGIGTSDTDRANAIEIKKNGDVYIGKKKLAGDNIFITDFTVADFNALQLGEIEELHIDAVALSEAIIAKKTILVPYNDGYVSGYSLLLGETADTEIYLSIYTHLGQYIYTEAYNGVIYASPTIIRDLQVERVQQISLDTLKNIAVANAVQTEGLLYAFPDQANGEEDEVLLSRGTVKTINGQTIMHDGDSDDINVAYPENEATSNAMILQPNTVTVWGGNVAGTIDISFALPLQGYVSEYIARFTVAADGVQLIVPGNVKWADGVLPAMTPGKTYEISFVDNLATFLEF